MSAARISLRSLCWALLLIASLAFIAWSRLSTEQPGEPAAVDGHGHLDPDSARGRRVFVHTLDEIDYIELDGQDLRARLVMMAEPGVPNAPSTWQAERRPPPAEASGMHIDDALAMFTRLRMEREFEDRPAQSGEFGLTSIPTNGDLTMHVVMKDASILRIDFGDAAQDGISRYVRISNPALLATVPDFQYRNLLALLRRTGTTAD